MEFFIYPERFWHLLWIVPAILALAAWASRRRRNALKQLLGAAHFPDSEAVPVGVSVSPGKRSVRFLLLLASALLLVAAWARPTWGEKIVPFTGAGRDIVIALDLSKSMLCEDIKPNRLEHAKRFADELTARLPGDRFGLVSFAGRAFDACPLTFDRVSFKTILNDQQIGTVPVGGTNLEAALKTAASAFETAENLGHCAIVLISDGGELSGSLAREAEKLRAAKLPVVVVGVGDPAVAAPIPLRDESGRTSYLKDRDGNTVNTRLEETPLAELAAKTGGVYIRSTTTEMGDTLAAAWIKKLTPGAQKENVHAVPVERREWFLVPALIAFSLYLLLGEAISQTHGLRANAFRILFRAPKMLAWATLLIALAGTLPTRAQEESASDTTDESATPESAETIYNRGLQAQEKGEITRSRELYQSALSRPQLSPELRAAATQNLGAGFHAEGRAGSESTAAAAQTNLDEALKNADSAGNKFEQARAFYRDFLCANESEDAAGTTRNLQILLNEMKQLEDLKKQIEELKKQMQEAAKKAQEAAQNQKQSNQEKNENADKSEQEKQQNAADQAREQAQKQTEQMQQSAEKLNNEALKNAAQQASRELQKAREEQKRGNGEKAEEHLQKAAEILQSEADKNQQSDREKQEQPENQNADGENSEKQNDGNDGQNEKQDDLSREPENQAEAQAEENAEENRELDQAATEAVLRDMAQEEAERRKAIQKIRNAETRQVEKDW